MSRLDEILTAERLAAINAPIEQACGLPAEAYTDQAFFEAEQNLLFPRSWMAVAFDTDIAEIGDAMPVTVCGTPLILVRSSASEVLALHNVCRHRATLVLPEATSGLKQFQCPYHAWTYALDGKLLATPFWDGTPGSSRCPVNPDHNSLVPVACEVWKHVILVNLSGDAAPIAEYAALFEREFGHVNLDELGLVHRRAWEFSANWKLVMDNWEVYHHVWVHHGIFDRMSDEVDFTTGDPYTDSLAEGNVMMLKGKFERPPRDLQGQRELPPLPLSGDGELPPGAANALLPNLTLTVTRTAFAPAIYVPIAPGVTRAEMAWFIAPEALDKDDFATGRKDLLDRWLGKSRQFNDRSGVRSQDHACMEWQQLARGSPVANDVKFSATWERDVYYFQRWIVARLTDTPPPR